MGTGSAASDCCCASSGAFPELSVWGAIVGGKEESAMAMGGAGTREAPGTRRWQRATRAVLKWPWERNLITGLAARQMHQNQETEIFVIAKVIHPPLPPQPPLVQNHGPVYYANMPLHNQTGPPHQP